MDTFTRNDLHNLLKKQDQRCVSIYMPAYRAGQETQQNPLRFKNLLEVAEERLAGNGVRSAEISSFLKPARQLQHDTFFWNNQDNGLAVFLSDDFFKYFRLPTRFEELVVTSPSFHILPLIPQVNGEGHYYVLSVNLKHMRLFKGNGYSLQEMKPNGLPTSVETVLQYEDPEKQIHSHTRTHQASGQRQAIFHGHGKGSDKVSPELYRQFFKKFDHALLDKLKSEKVPLILAGSEYLYLYRQASDYPHLLKHEIKKNVEDLSEQELHNYAREIVEPIFLEKQRKAEERFRALSRKKGKTSTSLEEILHSSRSGRIEILFVPSGAHAWGKYNGGSKSLQIHKTPQPDDEDLLNCAAAHTLLNGGSVFVVQPESIPHSAHAAAVFYF